MIEAGNIEAGNIEAGNAAAVISLKKAPVIDHVFAYPAGTPTLVMKQFLELLTE